MTEWFKCSERLPKNNQLVIAYYKFDPSDGSWDHSEGYKILYFSFGKNVHEYPKEKPGYTLTHWDQNEPNWGLDDRYKITHWTELLKPPENL